MKILKRFMLPVILVFAVTIEIFADGFIVIPDRIASPEPFPLEVKYHRVNVSLDGKNALTEIDQEFYNPTDRRLEGQYMFPIPSGAVIENFSMYINGVETRAEMLDASKARRIYEDIVRQMIDPALLEYSGQGVLKARIFPIEPRSVKRVKISYREIIQTDGNLYSYTYPLNTEKFSSKPLKEVSVTVTVKNSGPLKNIFSPTHNIDVRMKNGNSAVVSFEDLNVKPDTDFRLFYASAQGSLGVSNITYKTQKDAEGFFMMDIDPGREFDDVKIAEKDVTFVLDVSGSMRGKNLEQAKKALLYCVRNLNKGDRFQIISFSTEAETLFGKPVEKTEASVKEAEKFIENLRAVGGTNMEEAFEKASAGQSAAGRPEMIVFVTDGKPTIGITEDDGLLEKIKKSAGSSKKIFTFGIGYDINTHLLDKISEYSGTFRTYISPEENIDTEIARFFDKVSSPVLTNVELTVTGGVRMNKIYPEKIPDLYKGSSIAVLGRYRNSGKSEIVLSGVINGMKKEYRFKTEFSDNSADNSFIAPLWALRRTASLLDKIRLYGEVKELVDEVTDLARRYGIITPYTSYLILEDEKSLVQNRMIENDDRVLRQAAPVFDEATSKSMKREYEELFSDTGEKSVRSSSEIQKMNEAANNQQKDAYSYSEGGGNNGESARIKTKIIDGRSFYYSGDAWVDSEIQKSGYSKKVKIKFAGREYFSMIDSGLLDNDVASLGKNIRFVKDGILYEIHE